MLSNIAKVLPFFIVKRLYKTLSGESLREVHLKDEEWKVFWLDDETVLLIKRQ